MSNCFSVPQVPAAWQQVGLVLEESHQAAEIDLEMKSFLPGLLSEFQGEHGADSGAMMLPDPSAWREQDWEEMLPLENREVAETVKTPTQNHKAKGECC